MADIPEALVDKATEVINRWRPYGMRVPAKELAEYVLAAVWDQFERDVLAAVDAEVRREVTTERARLYAQIKDVIEQVGEAPGINDSARSGVALALAALRSRKSLEALAVADDRRAAVNGDAGAMVDREALVVKLTHLLGTDDATHYYDAPASRRAAAERYTDAILAAGVVADAADVRRQTAEDIAAAIEAEQTDPLEQLTTKVHANCPHHDGDTFPARECDICPHVANAAIGGYEHACTDAARLAREVGGDRG